MQLEITPTDTGYRLDGEIDMATADDLSELLQGERTNADPIELDFSGVTFMDSSGLRALLEGAGRSDPKHPLVILNPSAQVQRVLDISIPGGTPGLEVRTR